MPNCRSSTQPDEPAHADADKELGDEAEGPREGLAAGTTVDRLDGSAARLDLVEPFADCIRTLAKGLALLRADLATSRALALPCG